MRKIFAFLLLAHFGSAAPAQASQIRCVQTGDESRLRGPFESWREGDLLLVIGDAPGTYMKDGHQDFESRDAYLKVSRRIRDESMNWYDVDGPAMAFVTRYSTDTLITAKDRTGHTLQIELEPWKDKQATGQVLHGARVPGKLVPVTCFII